MYTLLNDEEMDALTNDTGSSSAWVQPSVPTLVRAAKALPVPVAHL